MWACEHYLLSQRFVILTDDRAIISALDETHGKKSYQSRLSRWADRLIPFDYQIEHIPGSSLGIVDYMSRHPTFEAPLPSSHDKLFVIKSIQAFHNALNSISTQPRPRIVPVGQVSYCNQLQPIRSFGKTGRNISYLLTKAVDQSPVTSYHQSHVGNQFRSSSLEGVENNTLLVNQSLKDMLIYRHNFSPLEGVISCSQSTSQSYASMQNRDCTSSSREVDFSCSGRFDQSQLSMQMRYAKPEVFDQTHCLRPYISEFSHAMDTSNNLAQNTTLKNSNTSNNTIEFANNTIEQTIFLNFVENFSTSSPNFRTSNQQRPGLSIVRPMNRLRRIDQIRTRNPARM